MNVSMMSQPSVTRKVVICNEQGLHARPAELFIRLANTFESDISVVKDGQRVDGKSMLEIFTLAAGKGTELSIEARGPDAQQAADALGKLVESGFADDTTSGDEE